MRRVGRRDNNEPQIIAVFTAADWLTIRTSVTDGPDFFACSPCGVIIGVEVKNPDSKKKKGRDYVREGQVVWHAAWTARSAPVFMIETVAQAEECIRLVINRRGTARMESTP